VGLGTGTAADPAVAPAPQAKGNRFSPPTPEQLAPKFPQLEILGLVGQGGMGAVYQARQRQLDRLVALKILPAEVSHDPAFAERFMREARALARLNHPNIVTVHDFGKADGYYYFLMEFIDGVTLRHLLAEGKLAPREALAIVPQVCEALQYAHDQGVVHRDIKPENILLDKTGRVKIADFGLARLVGTDTESRRLTQPREVMGTPHYMAPEQVEKPQFVDHRADIYSLGVVFYEMLTGELPLGRFAAPSQKVQVDVRLDEVVLRALEKEPERRYQQASQVRTDVETIAMAPAIPSTQGPKRNMTAHRHKTLWLGIGLGLACPVLVLAIWLFAAHNGGDPLQLAQEGWRLWQSGRPAEAIPKFGRAVKLDANNPETWNGLGWASFNTGKAQEAEKAFQKVLSLKPDHPGALNRLGQIYLAQKKYGEAETYLLKASPRAPAAWYGLARLYLIQGKFEQAEEWARKVVESGQGDEGARALLQAAKFHDKNFSDGLRLMIEPP
jgi:serine/threonine protein kinase